MGIKSALVKAKLSMSRLMLACKQKRTAFRHSRRVIPIAMIALTVLFYQNCSQTGFQTTTGVSTQNSTSTAASANSTNTNSGGTTTISGSGGVITTPPVAMPTPSPTPVVMNKNCVDPDTNQAIVAGGFYIGYSITTGTQAACNAAQIVGVTCNGTTGMLTPALVGAHSKTCQIVNQTCPSSTGAGVVMSVPSGNMIASVVTGYSANSAVYPILCSNLMGSSTCSAASTWSSTYPRYSSCTQQCVVSSTGSVVNSGASVTTAGYYKISSASDQATCTAGYVAPVTSVCSATTGLFAPTIPNAPSGTTYTSCKVVVPVVTPTPVVTPSPSPTPTPVVVPPVVGGGPMPFAKPTFIGAGYGGIIMTANYSQMSTQGSSYVSFLESLTTGLWPKGVTTGINSTFVSPTANISSYGSIKPSTAQDADDACNIRGITYANGLIVAIGGGTPNSACNYWGKILTSSDGVNWKMTAYDPSQNSVSFLSKAAYGVGKNTNGKGIWVVAGGGGSLLYSTDNTATWIIVRNNFGDNLRDLAFGNGVFVAVGDSSIVTSTDGINWTSSKSSGFSQITFGLGYFFAGSGNAVSKSADGVAWSSAGVSGYATFSNNIIYVSGSSVLASKDGVTFTNVGNGTGGPVYDFGDGTYASLSWDNYSTSVDLKSWRTVGLPTSFNQAVIVP